MVSEFITEEQIVESIIKKFKGKRIVLLAPLVRGRKGHYRELFEQIRKQGYLKVRIDGEIKDLLPKMQVDRYKIHDIEIVIDRFNVDEDDHIRIKQSVAQALKSGKSFIMVMNSDTNEIFNNTFYNLFFGETHHFIAGNITISIRSTSI